MAATDHDSWTLFTSLDLQGEAEQIELAGFLDGLVREFSTRGEGGLPHSLKALHEDEDEVLDEERAAVDFDAGASGSYMPKSMPSVAVAKNGSDVNNFTLPKGPLSPQTATEIVEVLRRGGALSMKAMKKLLRDIYKVLKMTPNVVSVNTQPKMARIHVVGDLHGQLSDLLHILDDAGMPSSENAYIFNGDFVDRGKNSVEVIAILFSLMLAWPESVFLNRGNHEDQAICSQPPPPHGCGGFSAEMKSKYDELCFSMVVEVFRYLPLVHLIDSAVFVVHGGLFGRSGVTLEDIQAIDRTDYTCAPLPESAPPESVEAARALDLKQLMRDCLWSDPKDLPGPAQFNHSRRQGQLFGPDVTESFLKQNGLQMVVRSHECVKLGFDQPYADSPHSLVTVFSASGYSNSNNLGAYITFCRQVSHGNRYFVVGSPTMHEAASSDIVVDAGQLLWTVHDYSCSEAVESLEEANKFSLRAIILRKRQELLENFIALDSSNTGAISTTQWAAIMADCTGLAINWEGAAPLLELERTDDGLVNYRGFIQDLRASSTAFSHSDDSEALFNAMYANRNVLELIFGFFDLNGDGIISKEEFMKGCEILNTKLPPGRQIQNESLFAAMDLDHSDGIDRNELFEVFRLVDAMDGKMDGQFDILKAAPAKGAEEKS